MDVAYPRKNLYNDEEIVLDRHPHWWFLAPRAALVVATCALAIFVLVHDFGDNSDLETPSRVVAGILVVLALAYFAQRVIAWRTTNFVVTTERCIYRSGVLKKTGIEIPLDRINTVFFSQTLFERILRAGDLAIESAGENSRQNFSDIIDPVGVQHAIYKEMEDNENRKSERIGRAARGDGVEATQVISPAEQLEKLADLHERGVITTEQFEAQKTKILGT